MPPSNPGGSQRNFVRWATTERITASSDQTGCEHLGESMAFSRRTLLSLAASAGTLSAFSGSAGAQVYPSRPITLIVPFAAGGPTDTIARIVVEGMRASLGQPIIIENVGGADGSIAVGRAARAAPDGYTISIGNVATHVLNGAAYSLSYDLLNDFEAISRLTDAPAFIDGKLALPAKDLKELIAWLKANPNKASAGVFATWSRLFGAYFQSSTGTRIQFVPYRGAAPAMQDLVAGQIDLMFDQAGNTLQQLRNSKIKAFAVAATKRLALAPDIPTMDEAGVPGFYLSVWHGMWAPKGTPKDVIAKLNSAVVTALANSGLQQKLIDLGQEVPPRDLQTPEALSAYQKAEAEKWWPIIKAANIKGE
jgi:tripartite-type tricarboxylate transporter receptor subunit TctC